MLSKHAYNLDLEMKNTDEIENVVLETESSISNDIVVESKKKVLVILSYAKYYKESIVLKKYKLDELKSIAKNNRLLIGGTKKVLLPRIEQHFAKELSTEKIQRLFRGHLVRFMFKLRGKGFKNNKDCVNETDFYTMEPLNEIAHELFFCYTDSKGFKYGFDITSLIHMIKSQNKPQNIKIINPYNRDLFPGVVIGNAIRLFGLLYILYPNLIDIKDFVKPVERKFTYNRNNQIRPPDQPNQYLQLINQRRLQLTIIRECENINTRINGLFMEIDQLGNYTQATWFTNLDRNQYIRLYRTLFDIWNYRANLSSDMKRKICIVNDPFFGLFGTRTYYYDISEERIKDACLRVFENLVFAGIDDDHRRIGSFHALTALTVVSLEAREAMPWLYDSIGY